MDWQPELAKLREREQLARELGGADKVKRQHDAGKLTVRERIDGLVDADSFHEIGAIAGKAEYDPEGNLKELVPSNCVMGRAQIDRRPVVVVGDDFTVRGGSADASISAKPLGSAGFGPFVSSSNCHQLTSTQMPSLKPTDL